MSDLWTAYPHEECDAWFVWVGVGVAATLLAMRPFDLPWIGWCRQSREWMDCHWWRTEELERRLKVPVST